MDSNSQRNNAPSTPPENASQLNSMESSTTRSRLDELPSELRNVLVNFAPLEMRAVLAEVPQFRIRRDDVLRARKSLCLWAAREGYLALLKWAHARGYPLLFPEDGRDVCASAARGGHLAVLQWLREQRCLWDYSTCDRAAEGGHLEVLQWALEHGCPRDSFGAAAAAAGGCQQSVLQWLQTQQWPMNESVTLNAALHGYVEVLEWAIANGCPIARDAAAAALCHSGSVRAVQWALTQPFGKFMCETGPGLTLEVLRYLREQRPDLTRDYPELRKLATQQLASVGDLAGLEWARENGFFDESAVVKGATEGGQLAVLQWATESGFPAEVNMTTLLSRGHLECLKWAVANGNAMPKYACRLAATHGNLRMLQWLREVGCEWDAQTMAQALYKGDWQVFEWARQQGCPLNEAVLEAAVHCGYAELLQWAFETTAGSIKPNPSWCAVAANAQVLKVLRDHGCPWSAVTCAEYARQGALEKLQWARRNGCPWDEATSAAAMGWNKLHVLQWAVENGCPMDSHTRKHWRKNPLAREFAPVVVEREEKRSILGGIRSLLPKSKKK